LLESFFNLVYLNQVDLLHGVRWPYDHESLPRKQLSNAKKKQKQQQHIVKHPQYSRENL